MSHAIQRAWEFCGRVYECPCRRIARVNKNNEMTRMM